eukprot:1655913-Pyramimonas_sp.AAC.1
MAPSRFAPRFLPSALGIGPSRQRKKKPSALGIGAKGQRHDANHYVCDLISASCAMSDSWSAPSAMSR